MSESRDHGPIDPGEHSVLARLSADGSFAPPLLLPDMSGDDGSPLLAPVSRSEGRYQVMGEIARGGVGVVLRGHDVDLGRPVAMKVLREEHAKDPDVLQRFVEEAQIGGQLQHPGVLPVYEMGLREDKRPYFTMKLVKGETLASLLEDPKRHGGRRGLLKFFEAVCQTMAYAHARGVIHRDLKPANIMVGSWGEVLVVDWGMGKVLREGGTETSREAGPDRSLIETLRSSTEGSASVVGSVMGTPRYMPPEQARGDIEAVAQRSDVFALGAILCEILTGEPPYGGTSQEAFAKACRGDLAEAHERLECCDEEEALVQLVRDCLMQAPRARPRDASVVAERISAHLAGLETQAREARVEAAEARVNAAGERRRRRLRLTFAGAMAGVVVLSLAGWSHLRSARQEREAETASFVSDVLNEANRLRGIAASSDLPSDFDAALKVASRAEELVQTRDATEAARERVRSSLDDLVRERGEAVRRETVRERDRQMVSRLEAIEARLEAEHNDMSVAADDLATAFRGYGIDPATQSDAVLLAAFQSSAISEALWSGFRLWTAADASARNQAGGAHSLGQIVKRQREEGPTALAATYLRIEPDPWWRRLQTAETVEEMQEMAAEPKLLERGIVAVASLAHRLLLFGDVPTCRNLMRLLVERHPDDFWLRLDAGRLYQAVLPRWSEALRHRTAAVALRPKSPNARFCLAQSLRGVGARDEALVQARIGLGLAPDHITLRATELQLLTDLGRWEEAREAGIALTKNAPDYVRGHEMLGKLLVNLQEFDAAEKSIQRALELSADSEEAWTDMAVIRRMRGDYYGARKAIQRVFDVDPGYMPAMLQTCSLYYELGEPDTARGFAEHMIAVGTPGFTHFANTIHADTSLALGDLKTASASARRALELLKAPGVEAGPLGAFAAVTARGVLAAIARAEGREAEATTLINEAVAKSGPVDRTSPWVAALHQRILIRRRSAESTPAQLRDQAPYIRAIVGYQHVLDGNSARALTIFRDLAKSSPAIFQHPLHEWPYHAACAAVAEGEWDDAYRWLSSNVDRLVPVVEEGNEGLRRQAVKRLSVIMLSPRLRPARLHEKFTKLPDAERPRWEALWKRLKALLEK